MPSFLLRWSRKRVPRMALCLTVWGTALWAADVGRNLDPVVLAGREMPGFLDQDAAAIALYRYQDTDNTWHPIPCQIDEKTGVSDSAYYGFKNGVLDPIDEVCFMAGDAGDPCFSDQLWPDDEESKQHPRYEFAVTNPMNGATGYVYAFWSASLPRSSTSYMQYANDAVVGQTYRIGHNASQAGGLPDTLIVLSSAGGDGLNLIDRQRLRITSTASRSGISEIKLVIKEKGTQKYPVKAGGITVGEINIDVRQSKVKAVAGPVRVVRTNYLAVHFWGKISILGISTEFDNTRLIPVGYKYYPYHYEVPYDSLVINLEKTVKDMADAGVSLKNSSIILCTMLNGNGYGMRFYTPRLTTDTDRQKGFKIDGVRDGSTYDRLGALTNASDWPGTHWYAVTADQASPASFAKNVTLFTIVQLRGNRPMANQEICYQDFDTDDTPKTLYGENGVFFSQTSNLPPVIPINITMKNYIFPQAMIYNELAGLFDQYATPVNLATQAVQNDKVPPGTIVDMAISSRTDDAITFSWTSVADDCTSGRAATYYMIRYSEEKPTGNRDWDWWARARQVYPVPNPTLPGTLQTFTIGSLEPDRQYYVGIRALDEANNAGPSIALVTSVTTPVELSSFKAQPRGDKIDLEWKTASESNNLGFEVQRRYVGDKEWQTLVFLEGRGTTVEETLYAWQDRPEQPGKIYYRLKQVDADGQSHLSDELTVSFKAPETYALQQNFPNPFNPATTISYEVPAGLGQMVKIQIFDLLGRRVKNLVSETAQAGYFRVLWDGRDDQGLATSAGVYFYVLSAGNVNLTRKMIKLQ